MTFAEDHKEELPKLRIGDIDFELVDAVTCVIERDQTKDNAEFKPSTARAIVRLVDNRWFPNYREGKVNKLKEEKLKEFNAKLVLDDKIQEIINLGLNTIGVKFGRVSRVEPEFKKNVITLAFDIELFRTLPEKKKKREEAKLVDPSDTASVSEATEAKTNQAQEEQEKGNAFLEAIDRGLKKLYDN